MNKNSFFLSILIQTSIILTLLSIKPTFATENNEWVVWYDKDDISIHYLKESTGDISLKASVKTQSSLSAFILFLQDTDNIPQWLDNANKSTIIEQVNDNENVFITHFDGFWPVQSRNMVIQTKYVQNKDNSISITSLDASDHIKPTQRSVRMAVNYAQWHIFPLGDNKTITIDYQLSVNPHLSLPNAIVRSLALSSMKKTLQNIQRQLPQSQWQDFKISGINDAPFQ